MKTIQGKRSSNVHEARAFKAAKRVMVLGAALVGLGATTACGAAAEYDEETGEISQSLVSRWGWPEFKSLTAINRLSTAVGDPAMCTPNGAHSKVIFTRDSSSFIQGQADVVGLVGSWGKFGGTNANRKFGGRPACGFLPGASSSYPFVLVAKGSKAPDGTTTDKRLYWAKGEWTVSNTAPPPTKALTQWTKIDNTQYSTNGNPAVGVYGDQVVLTYLNDSGQIRGNYWDAANDKFSATIAGPTLPTGWTGVGTPAIAFAEGWAYKFVILVRAKNSSGQYRLYETFFSNKKFTGAAGGSGSYQLLTLPSSAPTMQSDPAYEYDSYMGWSTLYYRNSDRIYQMSADVDDFRNSTVKWIDLGTSTPKIGGNIAVIGGVPYEQGRHWVLARGKGTDNNIYFGQSFNDEDLTQN